MMRKYVRLWDRVFFFFLQRDYVGWNRIVKELVDYWGNRVPDSNIRNRVLNSNVDRRIRLQYNPEPDPVNVGPDTCPNPKMKKLSKWKEQAIFSHQI